MSAASEPRLGKLRVQSVLYGNEPHRIAQAIEHLERAARLVQRTGLFEVVELVYGDCSPADTLRDAVLGHNAAGSALAKVEYVFFDENLGSALGHNRLLETGDSEFVLIMNPDIMMAPNALIELARASADPKVAITEAKQLPIEHPKAYQLATGETSWAATACTLIRRSVLVELKGFDYKTFFLYCDDVDFSWRARLQGYKVIYCPTAAAFHDKRLGAKGVWTVGWAEKYYSAEAALLLAYKYSREDLVEEISTHFEASDDDVWMKALNEFRRRKASGELPQQLDRNRKVAVFTHGVYAQHRFTM